MKTKIISILYHPPDYEAYSQSPRPEINWDTPNGSWVGIWGYDWPDLIGDEVLKLTSEFEYEVWQPDLRADKVYCHTFKNGLVHKLFPAKQKYRLYMKKYQKVIYSKKLLESISIEKKNFKVIININSIPLIFINLEIIKNYFRTTPITLTFHGNFTDYSKIAKKNILKYLFAIYKKSEFKKSLRMVNYITYQNQIQKNILSDLKTPVDKLLFLTMGVDFNFWKEDIKKNVENNTTTFLIASRLIPLKQIDKILIIFDGLKAKYNFKLLIAGHGNEEYENYLNKLSEGLIKSDHAQFLGYKTGDEMLNLYNQADYFITVSTSEGCSVSVMKAMACGVNIFSTKVGGTSDLLMKYNKGILVEPFNYDEWEEKIIKILEGNKFPMLDKRIALKHFHWPNVANEFIKIYKNLESEYEKE